MRLTFSIEIAASPESRQTMSFASDMAKKAKEQQREFEAKDAVFVERRRLIRAKAPAYWDEMRSWFQANVEEFNRELGADLLVIQMTASSQLNLRYTPPGRKPKDLQMRVNHESGEVFALVPPSQNPIRLSFAVEGERVILQSLSGTSSSLEENCQRLFGMLVD